MNQKRKKRISIICKYCGKIFNTYPSRKNTKKFCSQSCYSGSRVGVKLSIERVKKSADGHKGSRSHFWMGGITPINKIIRGSIEYKLWRTAVFERDDYTCIWCGAKSMVGKQVYLHADHIKPFSLYPELRFAIDNGRTLCLDCHKATDTYASKIKKYASTPKTEGDNSEQSEI